MIYGGVFSAFPPHHSRDSRQNDSASQAGSPCRNFMQEQQRENNPIYRLEAENDTRGPDRDTRQALDEKRMRQYRAQDTQQDKQAGLTDIGDRFSGDHERNRRKGCEHLLNTRHKRGGIPTHISSVEERERRAKLKLEIMPQSMPHFMLSGKEGF